MGPTRTRQFPGHTWQHLIVVSYLVTSVLNWSQLVIPLSLVAGLAMAGVGEGGVVRLAGGAVPARLTVLLAKVLLHLAVHALEEVRLMFEIF